MQLLRLARTVVGLTPVRAGRDYIPPVLTLRSPQAT
jgi:hypothetical protein